MRVLITGGAGFIGSHLAEALLARGDKVTVIDNYNTGRRDNLKDAEAQAPSRLRLIGGDVADGLLLRCVVRGASPDVVVHAAASYKDPSNWREDTRTNVQGTATVVQACQKYNVKRLIYFQTALCYGLSPEVPVSVRAPLNPGASSYAITKTAGEHFVRLSGLDWISFRLANVVGPRNLSGPPAAFYKRLAAGEQCTVVDTRRDFVAVQDLVRVVLRAIDGEGASGIYHVSSGRDYTIRSVYKGVVDAMELDRVPTPRFQRPNEDDAATILLDPVETHRVFAGWRTHVHLADALAEAVVWYREHGVGETYTHLKLEEADD